MGGQVIHPDVKREYPCLVRGDGVYVYDTAGHKYLDAASGVGVVALGYGRRELAEALADQAMTIPYVHGMRFANPPARELADKLAGFAPGPFHWSFFTSGGSEAVESALKITRQYFCEQGKTQKSRFIGRWQSFHGNTIGTMSVGGHVSRRGRYLPMLIECSHIPPANCYRCPYDLSYPGCGLRCAWALEQEIHYQGPERIAAFIAEPIVGAAAGATVPPPEYFPIIREICDRNDVLFIADEVITGFGRTGRNFGIEHWGVVPDMITAAKGISSGYAPLGAVLVNDRVMKVFQAGSGKVNHNFTYAGNPLACRVGCDVVDIIEQEGLVQRAAERGQQFFARMEALRRFPFVGDIRGRGLLAGIELVKDAASKEPFPIEFGASRHMDRLTQAEGLIVYPCDGTADGYRGDHLLLMPPLVISEQEIDELVAKLERAFERFEALLQG